MRTAFQVLQWMFCSSGCSSWCLGGGGARACGVEPLRPHSCGGRGARRSPSPADRPRSGARRAHGRGRRAVRRPPADRVAAQSRRLRRVRPRVRPARRRAARARCDGTSRRCNAGRSRRAKRRRPLAAVVALPVAQGALERLTRHVLGLRAVADAIGDVGMTLRTSGSGSWSGSIPFGAPRGRTDVIPSLSPVSPQPQRAVP